MSKGLVNGLKAGSSEYIRKVGDTVDWGRCALAQSSSCSSKWGGDQVLFVFLFLPCIPLVSTAALGSKGGSGPPVYVDLAYIPNHCSGKTADQDFFRRVRASYYVVSGNDPANGEPSRAVLDALLEGKAQWGENLQVSSKRHKVRIWSTLCQRPQ